MSGLSLSRRNTWGLLLLLFPALLWLGVAYLGSLFALLGQSIYSLDDFSGTILYEPSLATFKKLLTEPAHIDIILRTSGMAVVVSVACAVLAFPLVYYLVFHASKRERAWLYMSVMAPMWFSYLVKIYGWRVLLAKEGLLYWTLDKVGLTGVLEWFLTLPAVGGATLASSYLGMFVVFVYMWLPFMVLPIVSALERVPQNLRNAAADLGATPWRAFKDVTLPLAVPGVAAGSIFTFSLTLGDYIIPQVVGAPGYFIGMMVYVQQGTVGNLPLAAAFSIAPIVLILLYLSLAKRLGAFDAL
ncbi:MAG: ABC transporter permease [Formosimonas sp.]